MTRKRMLVIILYVCLLIFAVTSGWTQNDPATEKSTILANFKRLEGRWVRPDGGYVLEIRKIQNNGSFTAAYYNPRPIKVFRAESSRKDGNIHLFIELRDTNYPGSIYDLQYDPKSDRLKGTYFQAVERQTFSIEFLRSK